MERKQDPYHVQYYVVNIVNRSNCLISYTFVFRMSSSIMMKEFANGFIYAQKILIISLLNILCL